MRVGVFGDIGMSIKVLGKVRAGDQWDVGGELRRRVLAAFADASISVPHTNVLIERDENAGGTQGGGSAERADPGSK